ncbi:peptidase C39-like protein [Mumia flava]|uniref:Peptidase C39-like protein n=1 Tax=Mumia flava TaxID=1348852 RepID=A0A2M9BGS0_9ACTN|nr:C39 family peptidase [Mumia flava]PJJ57104.1 peptidase C39-like protein [Mumia flava]
MRGLVIGAAGTVAATVLTAPAAAATTAADTTAATRAAAPAAVSASGGARVSSARWRGAGLRAGSGRGWAVRAGAVRITRPTSRVRTGGRTYDRVRWTSPWAKVGFGAGEVIASWTAVTPRRTWISVSVKVRTADGRTGSWDQVARWAHTGKAIDRRSGRAQRDDLARLVTDVVKTRGGARARGWRIRVDLHRPAGSSATPRLTSVGAVASVRARAARATSTPRRASRVALTVPRYSQMLHRGTYGQWGGGGAAWCSPTSTAMVLRAQGRGPKPRAYAWVRRDVPQRFVVHAARGTYDHRYRGTGNWPFNTAYAGSYGTDAFVTRLTSLRQAEAFVRAGIPLVLSIRFGAGELAGAPISSTAGHLVVLRGFTASGDALVNDPAARRRSGVDRRYRRDQLERAWLRGSGGTTYVVRTPGRSLPPLPGHRW